MKHTLFETPHPSSEEQDKTGVYCPNCGSYQGTTGGLRVDSEWRKCTPSCPSLMQDGKKLVETGGGQDFPINYSCDHLQNKIGIINELEKIGYAPTLEENVPGVGPNQPRLPADMVAPQILPSDDSPATQMNHAMRQQNAHTVFGSVKDFLKFTTKNHPQYLEITEGGETHFLQYAPSSTNAVKNRFMGMLASLLKW